MTGKQKGRAATGIAVTGECCTDPKCSPSVERFQDHSVDALLGLLVGSSFAAVHSPFGERGPKIGPIRLSDDPEARRELLAAHVRGGSASVKYSPNDAEPQMVVVAPLVLAAYCPGTDGLCRFIVIDLDATDGHGSGGLVDPAHAMRCVAERCDALGLYDGLIVARSRGGAGRHVWLIPPYPVSLDDGIVAVGALAVSAFHVASRDAEDTGRPHAFRCGDGSLAQLGQPGCVELFPRSNEKPERGWAVTLPGAGAFAANGGGAIIDPFTDSPIGLASIPRCDPLAWTTFLNDARRELARRRRHIEPDRPRLQPTRPSLDIRDRLDPRTRALLDGRIEPGTRNTSLYAGVCNMLGCCVPVDEAMQLALSGARACGLPEREAHSVIQSAIRRAGR